MRSVRKSIAVLLALAVLPGMGGCFFAAAESAASDSAYIEQVLNLANNAEQEWSYSANADAWTLSVVSAVAYPELPEQQGVSVCVPGAYVTGIDTDGDGAANVNAASVDGAVKGMLVIDNAAQVVSANGQIYTAATAPVILNTGAAGYGSQKNSAAASTYAADGYINVSCGNRGKQDTAVEAQGNTYYTGDAPSCLVDQKAAARFVKYNILLGNLPGDVDRFVSTGGSGGGAHAVMFAATSNSPDFYDYQIEAGAVGVYKNEDGSYSTGVTIDGAHYDLSDGAWGCIAYSPITSLYEADMALAFEYSLNADYGFGTPFQAQLAEYLSEAYREYINGQKLSVLESAVGFDLNGDGDLEDEIALTIERDLEAYPETNGYYGTYLDLYLAEFTQNLRWMLDRLDYADGWTWFDENGAALSDDAVAAMTAEEKARAFLEGRYAKSGGGMNGGFGGMEMHRGGDLPDGDLPGDLPDGGMGGRFPGGAMGGGPGKGAQGPFGLDGAPDGGPRDGFGGGKQMDALPGEMEVGTPDAGTTQSASGGRDSSSYASYGDMVAAYESDIAELRAGDRYGNDIVALYNPLNYIGATDVERPAWVRMVMGAAEGDASLFNSLNLQLAWLNAGTDAVVEWQWDGGHVPSEVLGSSFALYVDQMYGEYVEGAAEIAEREAVPQAQNGTATAADGTDISSWVDAEDVSDVHIDIADAAAYRTAGASKAIPGFDVIDYGQEDYVFGSPEKDARHWNAKLLEIFKQYADVLEPLFNASID